MFKKFEVRWAEALGRPECPYLTRWTLTCFGWSIRLHHWTGSDDLRHLHDHAWDFVSIILKGGYHDVTYRGCALMRTLRRPGSIAVMQAEHRHAVELIDKKPCWSLVLSMPVRRKFGFYVNGKMMRPLRYFSRYKVHPCE